MSDESVNFTALLVDDEHYFRRFITQAIGKLGITNIVQASDGTEAVTQFKASSPDMVILDINMPNKDGLETLRDLRKLSDEVPIFISPPPPMNISSNSVWLMAPIFSCAKTCQPTNFPLN